MDIPGNEEADRLANLACQLPAPTDAFASHSTVRRTVKERGNRAFQKWWLTRKDHVGRYRNLDLTAKIGCPPELLTPRRTLRHLLAARLGYGDFKEYHLRFNHLDAALDCACGCPKTPGHIFQCAKIPRRLKARLAPSPRAAVDRILGRGFETFVGLADKSRYFTEIVHRPRLRRVPR